MTLRSLDLLDLPFLSPYRQDELPLDSARLFTRGDPLGAAAMLSYLNPRRHIYTAVNDEDGTRLIGQITQRGDESAARLTFLAPAEQIRPLSGPLLDHLAAQAGDWGAFHLLAEVDESHPAFRSLRQAGFAMYAWQRVWKLPATQKESVPTWTETSETDLPAIQSLHNQIVPALLQPVDPAPHKAGGMVCKSKGELRAYVRVDAGPAGVWILPLVPPDSDCAPEQLNNLISGWRDRPIYICVRSYQAWLESVLEDLGAEAGPRQAVMVRRLAAIVKEPQAISAMEKVLVKAKPAAPISRIEGEK